VRRERKKAEQAEISGNLPDCKRAMISNEIQENSVTIRTERPTNPEMIFKKGVDKGRDRGVPKSDYDSEQRQNHQNGDQPPLLIVP